MSLSSSVIITEPNEPMSFRNAAKPIAVGAVSYLNTKPLIYGLSDNLGDRGRLELSLPSKLATDLDSGSIDVGLIPVVEYFHRPSYRIVSDAVIACRGPVWSVRILFRGSPQNVKTLALDEGSRTSVALAKVLYQSKYGFVPETVPLPMSSNPLDSTADAVLVIGDRAMHPDRFKPEFHLDWDLGETWFEETGLPFVFAAWVAREPRFATDWLRQQFETSRDLGCENVDAIAKRFADSYQLSVDRCADYLTNYIRFRLGDDETRGLIEFEQRCQELKLLPDLR